MGIGAVTEQLETALKGLGRVSPLPRLGTISIHTGAYAAA